MAEKAIQTKENPSISKGEIRSPIVVVMGHVDHGKTSLLDYIRKTNVTAKEAGGITQATGAYEIIHVPHESRTNADITQNNAEVGKNIQRDSASILRESAKGDSAATGRRITFIDTPGHEAFSKMRSRGAKVADLAILVVAADDGVKPQTKESILTLKEAKTPFVVAINKIDKNNADIEKVKSDLAQNEVLLEGYGGDVSFQLISAKTGEGVSDLLDLILLASEFQDLEFNSDAPGRGFVIEAKLDKRRGNEVSVIIRDGVLKMGDLVYTSTARGKVKALQNFLRENVDKLSPSSPAVILGFESLPVIGEEFVVGDAPERTADEQTKAENQKNGTRGAKEKTAGILSLTLILKADTAGSLEALSPILRALKDEGVDIDVFSEKVGVISDGDVKEAISANAVIIGFNVKPEKAAESLAQNNGIKIITSNIIYDLIKKVQAELTNIKTPKPLGILEVLAIFNQKTREQLIGGKVLEGELKNKSYCDVLRAEAVIGTGRIMSLKMQKQDASRVEAGKECGVMFDSAVVIQVGDKIVIPPPNK